MSSDSPPDQKRGNQPEDAEALQMELAETCSYIISLRFLGMVFDDALGEPGTFFYVSWAQ